MRTKPVWTTRSRVPPARDQRADAVDRAVDDPPVEGGGALGDGLDGAVDDGGEAVVDVPGVLEDLGLEALGRHPVAQVDLAGGEDAEHGADGGRRRPG